MLVKALPSIPALSKADTATQVYFFDETMFGKNKLELTAPAAEPSHKSFFKKLSFFITKMVGGTGIEPATYCVSSNCSPS